MEISKIQQNVYNLGTNVAFPNQNRNYCLYDEKRTEELLEAKEEALPYIDTFLKNTNNEAQILDGLQVLDKMLDKGVKGIDKMYPTLSRFNNTSSPNIQVMLAGIYRKTLTPDAFGPLNKMLIRNSIYPAQYYFDPNEEIGGAILEYLKTQSAINLYNKN